jgi:adenosylcobinamide-GDP ribazoletransferase
VLNGLVTAFRTLTILPVPGKDAEKLSGALPWFPVVGAAMGLGLYALAFLAGYLPGAVTGPALGAAVLLAAGCFLTRGLHLDGLADWADGFGGSFEREKTLSIMKDPRVGAFGVIALIVVLIAKWSAFFCLINCNMAAWVVTALIVSRAAQVELAATLPYARAEGGTAGAFVDGARGKHRLIAWGLALLLTLLCCGPAAPAALLVAGLLALALRAWFKKRLGGVTGDLLGAASEIIETSVLILAAAGGPLLASVTGWWWIVELLRTCLKNITA